jgi:hypothetical protein
LAIDKVIVHFKGKVAFMQYTLKKHKCFRIKIYKFCDTYGYTYDMEVCLGKDRQVAITDMTATPATEKQLTRRVKGMTISYILTAAFLLLTFITI